MCRVKKELINGTTISRILRKEKKKRDLKNLRSKNLNEEKLINKNANFNINWRKKNLSKQIINFFNKNSKLEDSTASFSFQILFKEESNRLKLRSTFKTSIRRENNFIMNKQWYAIHNLEPIKISRRGREKEKIVGKKEIEIILKKY